jgi:hypothetical protein
MLVPANALAAAAPTAPNATVPRNSRREGSFEEISVEDIEISVGREDSRPTLPCEHGRIRVHDR